MIGVCLLLFALYKRKMPAACYAFGGDHKQLKAGEDGAAAKETKEDEDEEAKHPNIVKNGDANATTVTYTAEDEKKKEEEKEEKKEEEDGSEEEKKPLQDQE